ncbi:MAG: hypothetical protein U5R14_15630 [Gemmatimonadota bacterium]|nr:hypothetical protein [Gemmatimonadota bacterium]
MAERGHDVSLDDRLDDDQPALIVRFQPDRGPLAGLAPSGSERSGFEIRLGFERGPADPLDGTGGPGAQVIALEATGASLDRFTVLGQTPVEELTPSWVARRFVEFLERVLARS